MKDWKIIKWPDFSGSHVQRQLGVYMKMRVKSIAFFIFVLLLVTPSIAFAQEDLTLKLIPEKETYTVGEPIEIYVLFSTEGKPFLIWRELLSYSVYNSPEYHVPPSALKFEIVDDVGEKRPYIGKIRYSLAIPSIVALQAIWKNDIFGKKVDIAGKEFEYDIKDKGTYTIKAIYECQTKEWMESRIKKGVFKQKDIDEYYPLETIFSGKVESNAIQIKVVDSK